MNLEEVIERGRQGVPTSVDEALELADKYTLDELCDAADIIRQACTGNVIDTCSIVNGRSGRCSEDCKWCAQSRHHHTGIDEYEYVLHSAAVEAAKANHAKGVQRFALVTSGRRMPKNQLQHFCDIYRDVAKETGMYMCASMGLLGKEELQTLKDAGVRRYHCNLETSSSFFPSLCTTHTHDEKLATIRAAREVGLEVCSGGIIGMGETLRQRLEMAEESREAGADSMPVNLLQPIPGTPLENTPLLTEDEVILTVALMRLVAPKLTLRFAGGRARLSAKATRRILRGGMNGAMIGDLLTTIGNKVDQDYAMFEECGFKIS